MSAPLTLVRLAPDADRFADWAAHRRYLPARGDDLGYALHAAFKACLGDLAPQPFYWRTTREGVQLYGYSACSPDTLREAAAIPCADLAVCAALNLAALKARAMPSAWRAGQTLDFECRLRPVVRQNRDGERSRFREVDAAAHAARAGSESNRHGALGVLWGWALRATR